MNTDHPIAHELFAELWSALNRVRFHGDGALSTAFAVTDFAAATFAAAGAAVGELLEAGGWPPSVIDVDRVMASGWFHIFPPGPSQPLSGSQRKGAWQPPAIFADGGPWLTDFETADGRWLRVQGAFPTERQRLAKVLGTKVDLSEVAAAVRKYPGEEIEQKLVDAKTTVALSRTIAEVVAVAHGRGETAASECSGDCARQ
jgi:crotonobetainyl-CoA:carnitine CoA-transferase CaiB-like acyl-CoA transferase